MDAFGESLRLFADKVDSRARAVFVGCVSAVHESITDGSPLTGAPGQPVDTGNLRASWIPSFPAEWVGEVATNAVYAPSIEDGQQPPYTTASGKLVTPRPIQFRSKVGGAHSVKLTRNNWDRIVTEQVRIVRGG